MAVNSVDNTDKQIGSVNLNPLGQGGDFIAFPVVGDVGYSGQNALGALLSEGWWSGGATFTGDISVFSRTATYLVDVPQFLRRYLRSMRDVQREDGRFPDIAPLGGGFGGCTINLVKDELYDDFVKKAFSAYKEKFGREPKLYNVVISDGARKLA